MAAYAFSKYLLVGSNPWLRTYFWIESVQTLLDYRLYSAMQKQS